jgi:hypothetical protein
MNFLSCCCNPNNTFAGEALELIFRNYAGVLGLRKTPWKDWNRSNVVLGRLGRRRGQKSGELVAGIDRGSGGGDEGLTTISFWGLHGGEMWPAGASGGWPARTPLLPIFPLELGPARASNYVAVLRSSRRTRGRGEGTRGRPEEGARQWPRWQDRQCTQEKRRRVAVRSFDGGRQTARHEGV